MTTLRDAIAQTLRLRNVGWWQEFADAEADAILAAIRAHFEGKPERVSDETFGAYHEAYRSNGVRAGLAAALARIE